MAKIDFGGMVEDVVMRDEFPLQKAREVLKKETIAVIGYGVQGPAQAMNMRDNGFNVIVGQSQKFKRDYDKALKDGWVPGKTLFDVEEAAKKGTIIQYLVSDAAQKIIWPQIKACLNPGDALYFSHGFSIVYKEQTTVIPPANVDVIMVAPKGSGASVQGATFSPAAASTRATRCSRIPRAAPRSGPWRSASRSAPATSSRPRSSRRSTATSPASAASSWAPSRA